MVAERLLRMGNEDDDDLELFEKALEKISERDLFRGKYGVGAAPANKTREEPQPEDAEAAAEIARLRDLRAMEDAFAGIERVDNSKYRRHEPPPIERIAPQVEPTVEAPPVAAAIDEPVSEPAPLAELEARTLNYRGMKPGKVIGQLALAVDTAFKDGERVLRVIAGRDPALRRAILEWFDGPGTIYVRRVEITDPDGDTQLLVELEGRR